MLLLQQVISMKGINEKFYPFCNQVFKLSVEFVLIVPLDWYTKFSSKSYFQCKTHKIYS